MITFLRQWYTRQLSAKLVTLLLSFLIFSIAITSYYYYWSSAKIIRENVRVSTEQAAKQSADYLTLILTVGSDVGQQIFRDSNIQKVILEEANGNHTIDQKYEMHETVNNILNNLMYTSSFIRSVYLLKEEGSSWGSGSLNFSKVKRYTLNEQKWYQDVIDNNVDDLWLSLHYNPFSGGGENTEVVLSLIKPFRNLETRETLGVIMVNISGNLILEAIQKIHLGKTGKFFVVNKEGIILIDTDSKLWNTPISNASLKEVVLDTRDLQTEIIIEGVPHYVITQKLKNDWTIVGTVPINEIIGDIQDIRNKIWIFSTLFLLAASLAGVMFSRNITKPLKELKQQMGNIEKSDFSERTLVRSQDEVGQLSRRFNQMVSQIEMLIRQVNEEESKKRDAELRALRYQINPHFLYNTLASIRWMIKFKKLDEAYNGIAALVLLMEGSMEKKGVYSSLGAELDLLDKYMIIQKFRYGSHIKLNIDCDDKFLDIQIPRMLLQPIVENAIFHGIAPKEGSGTIIIHITSDGLVPPSLLITIKDDGLGIAKENIHHLLKSTSNPKSGMFGIGLNHVHETIQLYYGTNSGIKIESEPHVGTTIRLQLTLKECDWNVV
jgi:two-component system sensor histidine kinase YesM